MITPLDSETRKALIRLAEQDPQYRIPARIVLALTAGQAESSIATGAKVSTQQVKLWAQRYEEEGLAIFGDALAQPSPPAVKIEPIAVPAEDESEEEIYTPPPLIEDDEEENPTSRPTYRSRPPMHKRRSPGEGDKQRDSARPSYNRRRPRTSNRRDFEDRPPLKPPSIDDAVMEGFEGLLDDEETNIDDVEIPVRRVIAEVKVESEPDFSEAVPEPKPQIESPDKSVPISVGALAAAFNVEMEHARHISKLTRELFDITTSVHRLPNHYRDLLHAAALLHNIAFDTDPAVHHQRGRDLILQYELKDISADERQMLAVMTALHRADISPQQEPTYLTLPSALRSTTETLAALLRMGVGLDFSHSQTSEIVEWRMVPGELVIVVGGREAESKDIGRAQQKSNLWNRLYSMAQIRFATASQIQAEDSIEDILPRWPELEPTDTSIAISNKLRAHYGARLDALANRIRHESSGLLVPLQREFQRLIGVWEWLLPGSKPRQAFQEDVDWLARLIQDALSYAAVSDRINGLFSETDPEHDDPEAVRGLKELCTYYEESAILRYDNLREALESRRFTRWLRSATTELKGNSGDGIFFSSLVAERAWAYLGELRQVMNLVNRVDWNASLETLLTVDVANTFEADLRLLTDLLIYTGGLLGAELNQVLEVLEHLLDYVQAWQRMETVAQIASQAKTQPEMQQFSPLVGEAFSVLMRERADEMRWGLVEMWESLDTTMFRRALALAVAKP